MERLGETYLKKLEPNAQSFLDATLSCSEQPIELIFDHLVTLADDLFQLVAIEDLDAAPNVTNRTSIMQATGSHGHTFAAYA